MPKINEYYIQKEIKKPVEIVQEVNENNWWEAKQTVIKKSSLSSSAKSKLISKNGSDYISDNKEGYGPMPYNSGGCGGYLDNGWNNSIVMAMVWQENARERKELEEKVSLLESSLSRIEGELKEVKTQYRRGELSNYRLREIIRQKEEKIRDLERENREISGESAERWRKIGKLEAMIEELKGLL